MNRELLKPALEWLGIDPKRFWLLTDLFRTLAERGDVMQQNLGVHSDALNAAAIIYGLLGLLLAAFMVAGGTVRGAYLLAFLALTGIALVALLLVETANSLVNPAEALALVHQPVNGSTYTAAKLVHLGRIVVRVGGGLNLVPALAGLLLKDAAWFDPLRHLALAISVGMAVALTCCALFGWLLRYVPASRMRAAAQLLTALVPFSFQFGLSPAMRFLGKWQPEASFELQAGLALLLLTGVVLGLRALSADYLIRVTRLMQSGGRHRRATGRRRTGWLARLAGALGGGPAALGGFAWAAALARRDWQFLRMVLPVVPVVLMLGTLFREASNPFEGGFSLAFFLPHGVGLFVFATCVALPVGANPEGAWVFRLAPASAFPRLARGLFAWVMLVLVVLPHVPLAVLAFWFWPWADALTMTAFSLAAGAVYAGLSIDYVDCVPFTRLPSPDHGAMMLPTMMAGGAGMAMAVAFETLLFPSHLAVWLATLALVAAAVWLARLNVPSLAVNMQASLVEKPTDFKHLAQAID